MNSMKKKNSTPEKKDTLNILEEIDVEIDNDKLNEENNFNFNLGLNNKSIKNFNDLEVKNQIGHQINQSNNINISNFNSKDFKSFDFPTNKTNNESSNQAPNFFNNLNKNNNNNNSNFNINNFDFDSNSKNEVFMTKAEKPKLEIKVNNNNNKINEEGSNNNSDNKKPEHKPNPSFDMFKDFDIKKIQNKNFDFDFSASQPEKALKHNPTNQQQSNSNIHNNPFNFEIKNNPNNVNAGNFHASLPVNPSRVIANGDYYDEQAQQRFLGKDSVLSRTHKLSEREREKVAEELMLKNQNINFDKIILDVFENKKDKKKVNFEDQADYQEESNNVTSKKLIPPDYINLDDFQSGKMNEYNNKAVNRNNNNNHNNEHLAAKDSLGNINLRGDADEPVYEANPQSLDENDDLYVESQRDDNMLNNGIFNSYSEKHEKPFAKGSSAASAAGAKKMDYLRRKTKLMQDCLFSEEKSFAKINKINNNENSSLSVSLKKHFAYDAEVLVSQIEAIFLDLFQNYDFDHLKKKLKDPSKNLRLRAQARISYLQSFASFKANTNLINFNSAKLKTLETNAKFIREIKSDGNGFYRCFMFALVESYILNENLSGIRNIVNDVNEIIDSPLTNSLEVNKQEIFGIFNCILENLDMSDIANAYAVFVNAYGFSSNFDNVAINFYFNLKLNFIFCFLDCIPNKV